MIWPLVRAVLMAVFVKYVVLAVIVIVLIAVDDVMSYS
jgi:hypothetical protein